MSQNISLANISYTYILLRYLCFIHSVEILECLQHARHNCRYCGFAVIKTEKIQYSPAIQKHSVSMKSFVNQWHKETIIINLYGKSFEYSQTQKITSPRLSEIFGQVLPMNVHNKLG